MSWEVSNLIINDDSGIKIVKGGTSLTNVKPSNIYAQYQTDAPNYSSMNRNANTILLGKGNSSAGYTYTHGLTLPTDKTIYIQTDQNDGNVWFYWEGISSSSDFGSNAWSMRDFNIAQYYEPYGFNFAGTAYNFYGGVTGKTINNKIYLGQTWLGSSAQLLPIIWTTIPLSNFVINGERYDSNKSGGAGSGYIGNSLLSNKKMVGYNVPTSSAESTKTESVNEASENPVSGKPKIGNGHARIKLIRQGDNVDFFTNQLNPSLMVEDWDIANYKESLEYGNPTMQPTMFPEFFLTAWNFNIGNQWAPHTIIEDGQLVRSGRGANRSDAVFWIPINRINKSIIKINADYNVTQQYSYGSGFDRVGFWVGYVDSSNGWHSGRIGVKYPEDENWHNGDWIYSGEAVPYIDYIGIEGGDGIYHIKNIVLTVG